MAVIHIHYRLSANTVLSYGPFSIFQLMVLLSQPVRNGDLRYENFWNLKQTDGSSRSIALSRRPMPISVGISCEDAITAQCWNAKRYNSPISTKKHNPWQRNLVPITGGLYHGYSTITIRNVYLTRTYHGRGWMNPLKSASENGIGLLIRHLSAHFLKCLTPGHRMAVETILPLKTLEIAPNLGLSFWIWDLGFWIWGLGFPKRVSDSVSQNCTS